MIKQAIEDMPSCVQFMTVVPNIAARAVWMTPVMGLRDKSQEYLPTMLAG